MARPRANGKESDMNLHFWIRLAGAGLVATALATAAAAAPAPEIDALLDRAMARGLTPGVAVAVVEGDRVVWTAARGFADRETKRPVTPATRFYIASTTKTLTALAVARLADRGALDLDAPLSRALPGVKLHAGLSADSIRVVDLLTHTHGIDADGPVSARVAYTGEYTHAELLRALATQGPAPGGRAFAYSNLGYDLVGILLDPAHKGGWKRVVEREVIEPLGMTSTTAERSKLRDSELALPYRDTPDGFARTPLAKEDANIGAAGGHFSTALDLARLLRAELNGGRVDGSERLPARVIAGTQRARVVQSGRSMGYPRHAWALGWDLGTYEGDTLVFRMGSFPGYSSHVSFLPARGLGVVVLANGGMSGGVFADALANALYDRMLGRDAVASEAQLDSVAARVAGLRARLGTDLARRAARSQVLPRALEAYAGRYGNDDWGTLELRVRDGRLEAAMGVAHSPVEVFDAAKEKLRVELFGGGGVVETVFGEGDARARAVRMAGATFVRK
jgi:CubicO group peptidase (beta-lactamase class C family)